jgi:hypothetical protein
MNQTTITAKQAAAETLKQLRVPLPPEAIKPHPTKTYLSQINAIYVVDRLNDVFGLGGWTIQNQIIKEQPAEIRTILKKDQEVRIYKDTMVVVRSTFEAFIPEHPEPGPHIKMEAFGGNDNDDLGDAYKGACTDALTKIGSYLGIGADVWKDKNKGAASKPQSTQSDGEDKPKITWVNHGTKTWNEMAIAIAAHMGTKGGTAEEWINYYREKRAIGVSAKDKPAMIGQIAIELKNKQTNTGDKN